MGNVCNALQVRIDIFQNAIQIRSQNPLPETWIVKARKLWCIRNGTKHLTLRSSSVHADFSICWEYDPTAPAKRRLVIIAGEKYDLLDLASRCVATLEHFATAQSGMT